MKKYLFLAIAALGLAACAEKGLDNNGPANNGELEQSYVAITLAADDMATKADDGKYEVGLDTERAVKSAYVLFFKDGEPFHVIFDGTTSVNGGPNNYLKVDLANAATQNGMDNVSDIKNSVLVLQNYKGEYPNQILALINWTPTLAEYSLAQLRGNTPLPGTDEKGYMMSNAVYKDAAGQIVDATPLTIDQIFKNEDDAELNPVTIHVERIGAKVQLVNDADHRLFNVARTVTKADGTEVDVYAKIVDWELYNDIDRSYLIKNIDGNNTWTGEAFGFTNWNDPDWYRSYWAKSLGADKLNRTFTWENSGTVTPRIYLGENTNAWTEDNDTRTKIIIKAQLVEADGTTPVEVVNWYGKDYVTEETLLDVVASTLNNKYFYSADGQTFTGIEPTDLVCVARDVNEENAYEVYFQLSANTKTWYKYENGNYSPIATDKFNEELAAVQPALVYTGGMTYYYTDIKHLGKAGSTTEYGIVRNHVYNVNITKIDGFGTPVYSPTTDYIKPEHPTAITTYVAAQINILSWRVVANDYELN